jgi:hypothetical protein
MAPAGHSSWPTYGRTLCRFRRAIAFRNYRAKTVPVPRVSKVKFAELDTLLPKEVARVTLQQRKEIIEDRRQAQLQWYGE